MYFIPKFTKKVRLEGTTTTLNLSPDEIEKVINIIKTNDELYSLMIDYVRLARGSTPSINEEEEISMRQLIFPQINNILEAYKDYTYRVFSADIAETIFLRIEETGSKK